MCETFPNKQRVDVADHRNRVLSHIRTEPKLNVEPKRARIGFLFFTDWVAEF